LCEAVLKLSQADRIAHAERMQALLTDLQDLGDAMVRSRDGLSDQIRQLNQQKKAATAYKVADSRDDYGKRKTEEGKPEEE
jgi:Skp family chaperone for outer membrane proteins